ncbi:CAMK family protein kinase [Metarhizium album ARSEF 1941]|uniref:CAMK family protein kinase n=1 Tax=Metarhizium album (strain ARSEF 1941) TaxID=1081103 RepID=A0A0B2X239_METAS|nr:CAMK family protein kinase [Metarhizium album ARSEF 1941]KHN99767.1 CAMK family protein kinase [Metarhizium album ARSEF 1941]
MDDTDLIARVYPFVPIDEENNSENHAVKATTGSRLCVLPLLQKPRQEVRYGRDDRERTVSPDEAGDRTLSGLDLLPCIEVRFSKTPRSSHGVLFGCSRRCDVVLPDVGGLSNFQFSLTFDDKGRFIVKDMGSRLGTEVTYNRQGAGHRRNFQWIVGGDRNAKRKVRKIIKLQGLVKFQIVVAEHESHGSESYKDKVRKFRQGAGTTEDFFSDLDLPLRPDAEKPTGAHTPWDTPIYLKKELGRGGFGVVTHHWNVSTGEESAVKEALQKDEINLDEWLKEGTLLRRLSHKNIVKVQNVITDPPQLWLEYASKGSLRNCENITVAESVSILRQILSALVYLHESMPQIVHRDIKPDNILVRRRTSDEITVVLGDFGLYKEGESLNTACGTKAYAPPEIWESLNNYLSQQKHYSPAVDIWSLGMVMYALLFGLPRYRPYWAHATREMTWCEWIVHCLREEDRKKTDDLKQLLLNSMLQLSPNDRDSARECYLKVMALQRTIVDCKEVAYRGIPARKDKTVVISGTYTKEKPTVRNLQLRGKHSTGQDEYQTRLEDVLPTTESPESDEVPHPRHSLQTVHAEAVGEEEVENQARQRYDTPSSCYSKARANLKRSSEEIALQGPGSKRRSQRSISKALDDELDEAKAVEALLRCFPNGAPPPSGSSRSVALNGGARGPPETNGAGVAGPRPQSRHEGRSRFSHNKHIYRLDNYQ